MRFDQLISKLSDLITLQDIDETEREQEAKKIIDILKKRSESRLGDSALLHFRNDNGSPLLERAITCNRFYIVKLMLEAGHTPECTNLYGYTILPQTDERFTKLLLDAGANPNKTDFSGKAPLYYAIHELIGKSNTSLARIEMLLSHGAIIKDPELLFNVLRQWDIYDPDLYFCLNKLYEHLKSNSILALLKQAEEYLQKLEKDVFSVRRPLIQTALIDVGILKTVGEIIAEYDTPSYDLPSSVFFKPTPKLNPADRTVQPSLEEKHDDQQIEAKLQIQCASVCSLM